MPSSPEALAAAPPPVPAPAPVWQPDELRSAVHLAPEAPSPSVRTEPFEVSSAVGIPAQLVEAARRRAEAAGYAAGWSRGAAAARHAVEAEGIVQRDAAAREAARTRSDVTHALSALTDAAAQLLGHSAPSIVGIEDLIVASAFDVAEAVVGAHLRDDPRRGAAAVARALTLLPSVDSVSVALHPADRSAILASGSPVPDNVRLMDDPSLAPGDAVASSGSATVDARIGPALERVRGVLS